MGALIDQLYWRGCKVAYASLEPGVHVSGHASKPQQQRVLETVRRDGARYGASVPFPGPIRQYVA